MNHKNRVCAAICFSCSRRGDLRGIICARPGLALLPRLVYTGPFFGTGAALQQAFIRSS